MRLLWTDLREDTVTDSGDGAMPDAPDADPFLDQPPLEPVLE
jgi:hypothetical protein